MDIWEEEDAISACSVFWRVSPVYLVSVHKRYYIYDTTQRKTLNDAEVKKKHEANKPSGIHS
jgi:hypothetical protein